MCACVKSFCACFLPFNKIKMPPNSSASIRHAMIGRERPVDHPESFVIMRARMDGSIIDEENVYADSVSLTLELDFALRLMPPMTIFLGCNNCLFPISFTDDISDVIYCVKQPTIPAAFVVQVFENSMIHSNVDVENVSDIFWRTHLKCGNCGILLSIRSLNQNNAQVDEYSNENNCIIFDANCVDFLCKQTIWI